jgi:hypothetical protein
MKRINHLFDLLENIKKTDAMIAMHHAHSNGSLMEQQYEALNTKQIAELIEELTTPPYLSKQSLNLIQLILAKYNPCISKNSVESDKDLSKLEEAIL